MNADEALTESRHRRIVAYAIIIFICGAFFGGFFMTKCSAAHIYYESKYADTNPITDLVNSTDLKVGTVIINLRCAGNTLSPTVEIWNDLAPEDKIIRDIMPNGELEEQLIPGNFTAYLPDGNGGQPEIAHFNIVAQKIARVTFTGHAITQTAPEIIAPKPTQTPGPDCHWERVCDPGYWEQKCFGHGHHRICIPYWVPGCCHSVWVC